MVFFFIDYLRPFSPPSFFHKQFSVAASVVQMLNDVLFLLHFFNNFRVGRGVFLKRLAQTSPLASGEGELPSPLKHGNDTR